ncbi:MAG: N-acetyltransferase [Acidaminococcaceae bacterium]
MKKEEIDELAVLWLKTSLIAHNFVAADFWHQKMPLVQTEYLPKSITYVYEKDDKPLGFLSFVKENEIGGLFVDCNAQNKGIGYALMEQAKRLFSFLELDVYARNEKAVHFYLRQGFQAVVVFKGEDTGEESIRMRWIQ